MWQNQHHIYFSVDDVWPSWERDESDGEPQWVTSEKEQFRIHRDKDGDNKLNKVSIEASSLALYWNLYCFGLQREYHTICSSKIMFTILLKFDFLLHYCFLGAVGQWRTVCL